jgi:CheY-like chemotaxis protein
MKPCKILIIDDDVDDVEILAGAFSECGVCDVHYVYTAMQAFAYLEAVENAQLPKLIITDMHLPGITGAEFLTDLKGMEPYKNIPAIVLSSIKSAADIEKAKSMGALEYRLKPSTYAEYQKVAAELLKTIDLSL